MDDYEKELVEIVARLQRGGVVASIRGDGAARFVFAERGLKAVEISRSGDAWWIDAFGDGCVQANWNILATDDALSMAEFWLMPAGIKVQPSE